jgi:D-tagatose-1,6-bisphosphate aldolase subunit GatZ/KbaZ
MTPPCRSGTVPNGTIQLRGRAILVSL